MKLRDELFGTPEKLVIDPVLGGIPFFDHEEKILSHPLFQRLRHVVQNGMLHMVFPGAIHTRFQHSIGSMHMTGKLFKSVIRSYLVDISNRRDININERQKNAIQYFYTCLRLAAVLHDTGHFPFSHQFATCDKISLLLKNPQLFDKLWANEPWSKYYQKKPTKLSHEHYSIRCGHQILKDSLPKGTIDPIDVMSMFEKTECNTSQKFNIHSRELLSLFLNSNKENENYTDEQIGKIFQSFFKTIISGELDIDKMDYLLRDSYFSGCKYGIYNLDHLLSTLVMGYELKEPWFGLAISKKGIGPLEDFVHSRFQLYMEVYSHKTVVGFNWLLNKAIGEIFSLQEYKDIILESLSNIEEYKDFTDTFFWEKFREIGNNKPGSASERIIYRKKLKHLHSENNLSPSEINKIIEKFRDKKGINITYWESESKFSKISGSFENLRILVLDAYTGVRTLQLIKRHSSFFEKFKDTTITHFYEEPSLND